jgi:hypothetical protein
MSTNLGIAAISLHPSKAIHVHQCEYKTCQARVDSELQKIYLYPTMCCWGTTCNAVFSDDYKVSCAHMYLHIVHHFAQNASSFRKCGFEACHELYDLRFYESVFFLNRFLPGYRVTAPRSTCFRTTIFRSHQSASYVSATSATPGMSYA